MAGMGAAKESAGSTKSLMNEPKYRPALKGPIDKFASPPRLTKETKAYEMKKKMIWVVVFLVVAGAALWGPIVSNVEQARYDVVEKEGAIEIRTYVPMIVAQAKVSGNREDSINEGFRIIADYIFGNNTGAQKIAMTAPVSQEPGEISGEKIAMTAPVIQEPENGAWVVRFMMPSSYTLETLPKPKNGAVELIQIPSKKFAVIRFSGTANETSLKEETKKLLAFVEEKKLKTLSDPTYAFFNPPWTLPFLRRNEVMVEIK